MISIHRLTLVLGSIISTHSAAAWFILLCFNSSSPFSSQPPKEVSPSFSSSSLSPSNLLHFTPTCCLALWTSRFTDTHITTPSRRRSENWVFSNVMTGNEVEERIRWQDVGETALSRPSRGLIGAKTHLDLAPHHPPTSSTTSLTHSLTQSTRHPGEKIRPLPDEATIYRPTSITETTSSKSIREGLFF